MIDERFAFITDSNGNKYQVLRYAPLIDENGNPVIDEEGREVVTPIDWDEQETQKLIASMTPDSTDDTQV